MDESKQFRIPQVKITSAVDLALFISRVREEAKKLKTQWGGEDPKIIEITMAIMDRKHFNAINKELSEEFNRLTAESEILINSPDANTPKMKTRRKILASEINLVLEKQLELGKVIDIQRAEAVVLRASDSQLARANSLVKSLISELDLIANPRIGLN